MKLIYNLQGAYRCSFYMTCVSQIRIPFIKPVISQLPVSTLGWVENMGNSVSLGLSTINHCCRHRLERAAACLTAYILTRWYLDMYTYSMSWHVDSLLTQKPHILNECTKTNLQLQKKKHFFIHTKKVSHSFFIYLFFFSFFTLFIWGNW